MEALYAVVPLASPHFSQKIYCNIGSGRIFKCYLIDRPHRTVSTIAGFNHRNTWSYNLIQRFITISCETCRQKAAIKFEKIRSQYHSTNSLSLLFFSLKNISKVECVFSSNLLISFLVFLRVSRGSIFPGTSFFICPLIREESQNDSSPEFVGRHAVQ